MIHPSDGRTDRRTGDSIIRAIAYILSRVKMNQTVNDGVAHSRIGTLDQPVVA